MKSGEHNIAALDRELARKKLLANIVKTETGCWIFQLTPSRKYPQLDFNGARWSVHRLSYIIHKGEIPKPLTIDHLCRQTRCVNPDHLEAVTNKVNGLRGYSEPAKNARKTHCIRSHELSPGNLYKYKEGRRCAECNRERAARRYHQAKSRPPKLPLKANCIRGHTLTDDNLVWSGCRYECKTCKRERDRNYYLAKRNAICERFGLTK